jgi:hypothetical protein
LVTNHAIYFHPLALKGHFKFFGIANRLPIGVKGKQFNPHLSPAIYCNAKSAHACCVMLLHPLRRTVKYASSGCSPLPCIHGHLWHFATIPGDKCGLIVLSRPPETIRHSSIKQMSFTGSVYSSTDFFSFFSRYARTSLTSLYIWFSSGGVDASIHWDLNFKTLKIP